MSRLPDRRFRVAARRRPIAVVGQPLVQEGYDAAPAGAQQDTPHLASYAAVEVDLGRVPEARRLDLSLDGPDGSRLVAVFADGGVALEVTADGRTTRHRSRRRGTVVAPPDRLGLALTGTHLTVFTSEAGRWLARGRVDLADRCATRDPDWLAGLRSGWAWQGPGPAPVRGWRAGDFGQLGLRDLRVVTRADGTPYRPDGATLITATSAGPGFFDTAHTSVWRVDHARLTIDHCSDLYFERPDRPGAFGDHATHLVRDGDRWLVATSTWGDFAPPPRFGRGEVATGYKPYVDITLGESTADLTRGRHRIGTRALEMPTDGLESVGVWDPHLVRDGDGWLAGFVSARSYFDFHPALAAGPGLDRLSLLGAATDRHATEGTTLLPSDAGWVVLASDGADNPRALRRRYPVFDLALRETGTLAAPYPTNIPWPTLVPPAPGEDWLMVTFDGTPAGGGLTGYGTHGDVVLMCADRH